MNIPDDVLQKHFKAFHVFGFHKVASLFPMMSPEEHTELVKSIKKNGYRQDQPIWLHEGWIIDGRNRFLACIDAVASPIFAQWNGYGSLVEFVVALNLQRRHLSSSQKATVALEIERLLAVEAEKRMTAGINQHSSPTQKIAEGEKGESREKAAKMTGTNRQYVSDAKKIAIAAPDMLESIRDGQMSIPEAKTLINLPEEKRAAVLEQVRAGEDVKKVIRAARREHRNENFNAKPLPEGKFRCVLADPPWPYDMYNQIDSHGSAESHYPTMEIADIAGLPVENLADENCALFLWATWPNLFNAEKVALAWGFEYRTCAFTWVKLRKGRDAKNIAILTDPLLFHNGRGNWTHSNTEVCLLFVRGSVPRVDETIKQLILAPLSEKHSEKPVEQYERIERLVNGPYIELFARQKYSDKWDVWGNEV